MEHFIVIADSIDGIIFAQSPPEESATAAYMGYSPAVASIPAEHASRTFDWATDDAWDWAFTTFADHQVWHIVDGVVTEYMNCSA